MRTQRALLFVALWLTAPVSPAQPPMGGPPPEAFDACDGKSGGDGCGFLAPHGKVSGACRQMHEARLVCVPAGDLGGGPPGGPGSSSVDISRGNPDATRVFSRIPDTGQGSCFDNDKVIPCPGEGTPFHGQDAQYLGAQPQYVDNGDQTVSDLVTGLTWQQAHNEERLDFPSAKNRCETLELGGFDDWRLPHIKELFSIADFSGATGRRPFVGSDFEIRAPDASVLRGDRFGADHRPDMMGQTWSDSLYSGDHWGRPGVEATFFFNFLDGRIKQAPTGGRLGLFHRCVRGASWGSNDFKDNGDGTVTDHASGLMWQRADDGRQRDWQAALAYCEAQRLAGYQDWRLPNAKELQSIVDYSRHDPALDTKFFDQHDKDGWFWSSTTHGENVHFAVYVCFGKCISVEGVDVHGAGAQRSDPKTGDPSDYREGMGGQKDQVRIFNYARCVRSAG